MKVWDYKSNKDDRLSKLTEKDNDISMTKIDMAKHLISLINFKDGDVVMEPCKGTGSFYNNLPTNTKNIFCEINEGIDYLNFDGEVDITLSNPPFVPRKLFWEFHRKAMKTTKREIYWLINILSLNVFTPNRLEEMIGNGWYIESFHIVSDKRWYGRYTWVKFTKDKNNIFTYTKKLY